MNKYLRMLIEHNPRHYTKIKIRGDEFKICSRCLGTTIAGFISFIIFGLLYYYHYEFEFFTVFLLSLGLAFICFIDWVSAKTPLWKGNNNIRILAGAFLGISVNLWFWLLPVSWYDRIWSLILIETIFGLIIFAVNYHEMKNGLLEVYENHFYNYKKTYCCDCGCCSTVCCVLPQYICYCALLVFCCICPIVIIFCLLKK